MTLIADSLTSDDEEEENKFQLGGALVFSDVKNNTIAEETVDNASTATSAPTLTAGQGIDLARAGSLKLRVLPLAAQITRLMAVKRDRYSVC